MALSYDPSTKKWNVQKLKTDNPTNRPVLNQLNLQVSAPVSSGINQMYREETKNLTVPLNATRDQIKQALIGIGFNSGEPTSSGNWSSTARDRLNKEIANILKIQKDTKDANKYNLNLNREADALNKENEKINASYDKVVSLASTTKGGDYKVIRDQIRKIPVSQGVKDALETNYKAFYRTEKLKTWDPKLGAKPLYGDFDAAYYKKENPEVATRWQQAVADDDIDITERYGENSFYLQHYTTQGKAAGKRGNAPEVKESVEKYIEKKPTDADIQAARDMQLGVDTETRTQRLLNIPGVKEEWEKAKAGDQYWKDLGSKNFLNPEKEDEFAVLFRLSERPEDKQIKFGYNIEAIDGATKVSGITELEDALFQAAGERAVVDVKRFGALTQNVLKDTINEMKKAKQKEQTLSMFSQFDEFSEITNIGKDLASSIMGDINAGGILGSGSENMQKSLEESIEKATGVRNNVIYNWQNWFDNTLKEKYSKEQTLSYQVETKDEKTGQTKTTEESLKIDKNFAQQFIDKYLAPRFNTSKSMDEFTSYLDVLKQEQNPFQTQDIVDALKLTAQMKSQTYLDEIKKINDRYFDSTFYFNPSGGPYKKAGYENQAKVVNQDWEAAKKGDQYWQQQAYRYGVDLNDKDAFAKLHFQVKGKNLLFDGAEDILSADSVAETIYEDFLPALTKEAEKQETVFGQFLKPDEVANDLLKGVEIGDENWNEILKKAGLDDFKGTRDDLKNYLADSFRTSPAQEIRAQIDFMNKRKERPTQENLGISYIERASDYSPTESGTETGLYQTFKKAGYKGTEDEFYTDLFPDVDRAEQQFITKATQGKGLTFANINMKDPMAAFSSLSNIFGDEEEDADTQNEDDDWGQNSYFKIDFGRDKMNSKQKESDSMFGGLSSLFEGF